MELEELKEMVENIINQKFSDWKKTTKLTGVYILYKKDSISYIGSTKDLKKRLRGLFSNNPKRHILNKRVEK